MVVRSLTTHQLRNSDLGPKCVPSQALTHLHMRYETISCLNTKPLTRDAKAKQLHFQKHLRMSRMLGQSMPFLISGRSMLHMSIRLKES